jgi:hypothetical protein
MDLDLDVMRQRSHHHLTPASTVSQHLPNSNSGTKALWPQGNLDLATNRDVPDVARWNPTSRATIF